MSEPVHDMAAFVRSVELGGFSAAAREMGLTPSALSKLVTRLEGRLGVRLLNRTTRKLALTPEGELYLVRCQRILHDIADAEAEVTRSRERPSGLLRINCGVAFGQHQLAPALPRFFERYPEVAVDLTLTDRVVDLIEEGADLAIRSGTLTDSSLIARKFCDTERLICAAPTYLARHGMPESPEDLRQHNCIVITGNPALRRWPFDGPEGLEVIEVHGNVTANNAETVLQLALLGHGIVRLGDIVVAEALRAGRLVPLLVDRHHVERVPFFAVYPAGRHRSPKIGAMVDFLVEEFASAPWGHPTVARRPAQLARRGGRGA